MNNYYVIEPTDVVHGKEWKSHKYISKIMKNGKWVYQYTKNKVRGPVTNKNGKIQYSPNVKTMDYKSYDQRIKNTYGIFDGIYDVDNILMEPINFSRKGASWGGADPAKGMAYYNAIRSKVDKQKLNLAYVNNRKKSDYSQHSQQHRADSSKHYTPESNRGTKSYSPTVKTETYSDGKRRYTEPKDWQTRGSSRKGTTSRKYKKAMNRTRNGINN